MTDRRKHVNEIPSDVVTKFINTTANQMFKGGVCLFFFFVRLYFLQDFKEKKAEPEQIGHLVVQPQYQDLMEKMQKNACAVGLFRVFLRHSTMQGQWN